MINGVSGFYDPKENKIVVWTLCFFFSTRDFVIQFLSHRGLILYHIINFLCNFKSNFGCVARHVTFRFSYIWFQGHANHGHSRHRNSLKLKDIEDQFLYAVLQSKCCEHDQTQETFRIVLLDLPLMVNVV